MPSVQTSLVPVPDGGVLDKGVHRSALRVYYDDTDAGGVVYHANYLRWFERARSDLVTLLGVDQREGLEQGLGVYAVASLAIRYASPARLGDAVLIETTVGKLGPATCTFTQRALRDGTLLAEADVRVGFVGPDGRPRRQPAEWRQRFEPFAQSPVSASEGQT